MMMMRFVSLQFTRGQHCTVTSQLEYSHHNERAGAEPKGVVGVIIIVVTCLKGQNPLHQF